MRPPGSRSGVGEGGVAEGGLTGFLMLVISCSPVQVQAKSFHCSSEAPGALKHSVLCACWLKRPRTSVSVLPLKTFLQPGLPHVMRYSMIVYSMIL